MPNRPTGVAELQKQISAEVLQEEKSEKVETDPEVRILALADFGRGHIAEICLNYNIMAQFIPGDENTLSDMDFN